MLFLSYIILFIYIFFTVYALIRFIVVAATRWSRTDPVFRTTTCATWIACCILERDGRCQKSLMRAASLTIDNQVYYYCENHTRSRAIYENQQYSLWAAVVFDAIWIIYKKNKNLIPPENVRIDFFESNLRYSCINRATTEWSIVIILLQVTTHVQYFFETWLYLNIYTKNILSFNDQPYYE